MPGPVGVTQSHQLSGDWDTVSSAQLAISIGKERGDTVILQWVKLGAGVALTRLSYL